MKLQKKNDINDIIKYLITNCTRVYLYLFNNYTRKYIHT